MPPPEVASTYLYTIRHPGVFAEFYFPKRVLYQSEIVEALKDGVEGSKVKKYLARNACKLLKELGAYPYVLDPQRYEGRRTETISVADAKRRVEMYKNPFFGWSTYDVGGAFLNIKVDEETKIETRELQDELTQIIRVIHRFESGLEITKKKGYERIVQSATSWLLMNYCHKVALPPYGEAETQKFIEEHTPFTEQELAYVKTNYPAIATEVFQWFDDCVLFTFGYLARRFWKKVAEVGRQEDEIWVTSFFNLGINILRPGKKS
ncbi:MAG: hypothetical protein ACRDF4_04240 [Rhabdochlamydiaceae bacterium]